jgi:ATP-dependent DNA helicase PIF1
MLTGIQRRVVQVHLPDGQYKMVPQINFMVEERGMPWVLYRCQFPMKLAFALTINKAQGRSLEVVGVDLWESDFTHRQLYVALSRATSVARIKNLMKPNAQRVMENIVFPEVLLRQHVNS